MDSKFFTNLLIFFIFFSTWVFYLGYSKELGSNFLQAGNGGGGGGGNGSQCVQKLLVCQPYLHSPSTAPPTCCLLLREVAANEVECLCRAITDPVLLKSFNITEQDAMNLSKACGANSDLSVCKKSPSPTSPEVPSVTPPAGNSSTNSSSSSKKNAGERMHNLEKSTSLIAVFVAFIFLSVLA